MITVLELRRFRSYRLRSSHSLRHSLVATSTIGACRTTREHELPQSEAMASSISAGDQSDKGNAVTDEYHRAVDFRLPLSRATIERRSARRWRPNPLWLASLALFIQLSVRPSVRTAPPQALVAEAPPAEPASAHAAATPPRHVYQGVARLSTTRTSEAMVR